MVEAKPHLHSPLRVPVSFDNCQESCYWSYSTFHFLCHALPLFVHVNPQLL